LASLKTAFPFPAPNCFGGETQRDKTKFAFLPTLHKLGGSYSLTGDAMRASQAREIPISRYLEIEGMRPASVRNGGRELWYSSPIRSGDSTPSFKVDTVLNVWYDHGLAQGGTLIDLVCELKSVTVSEALTIIDATGLGPQTHRGTNAQRLFTPSDMSVIVPVRDAAAGEKEKEQGRGGSSAFEILSVHDVRHPALLDYLKTRAIDRVIGCKMLKEVSFAPKSGVGRFFALGFACGQGYDARSAIFKGFLGTGKDISVIAGTGDPECDVREVAVFEGFMDYLSLLTLKRTNALKADAIILHSAALKRRASAAIKAGTYQRVSLYLDHDDAGRATTKFLIAETGRDNATDASALYAGYKDLNERLVATHQQGRS